MLLAADQADVERQLARPRVGEHRRTRADREVSVRDGGDRLDGESLRRGLEADEVRLGERRELQSSEVLIR